MGFNNINLRNKKKPYTQNKAMIIRLVNTINLSRCIGVFFYG